MNERMNVPVKLVSFRMTIAELDKSHLMSYSLSINQQPIARSSRWPSAETTAHAPLAAGHL